MEFDWNAAKHQKNIRDTRWRLIFCRTTTRTVDPASLFLQITALREAEPATA
jgi:hypothetical protein